MFIIIPVRRKKMTPRGAKITAFLGIAAVGFLIWTQFQPHTIRQGKLNVDPGKAMVLKLDIPAEKTHIDAVFTPEGAPDDDYTVFIIDQAAHDKVEFHQATSGNVEHITSAQGSGPLSLRQVPLNAGTYYIYAANPTHTPLALTYAITRAPNWH